MVNKLEGYHQSFHPEVLKKEPLYVMKFGGSSVGSARSIDEEVVGFIQKNTRDGKRIVLVVSAMKGVTEKLLVLSHAILNGQQHEVYDSMREIYKRHDDVILEAIVSPLNRISMHEQFDCMFANLRDDTTLRNGDIMAMQDRVIAYGERFSSIIVSGVLSDHFLPAKAVDASGIILTDENFGQARPYIGKTKVGPIIEVLVQGEIPVVTGFIGSTEDGRVTTLGRNSSDYVAGILGAELGAEEVWICKDVPGLLDSTGVVIPTIATQQVYKVEGGTRVIHPGALGLADRYDFEIKIKCTFDPDAAGTRIFPASQV